MAENQNQPSQQQIMQALQQKIGNLELTLNALLGVLVDKDVVDQEEVNEKAQEIIQDIQEQHAEHDHDHVEE